MNGPRSTALVRLLPPGALALLVGVTLAGARRGPAGHASPAAEIEHWSAIVAADTASDEGHASTRKVSGPPLALARQALARGRTLLAIFRLGTVRPYLVAQKYVDSLPDSMATPEALEGEWRRMGDVLHEDLRAPSPRSFADVHPAALRAMAEAAAMQVHVYYDGSLEFGRATDPGSGLYYIGQAIAQREWAALCRGWSSPAGGAEPAFRTLGGELDSLEGEILAAYRPPASIDRHSEFITVGAALKEAREPDQAGLARGALLRYLQAAFRLDPLRSAPPKFDPLATPGRLRALETRFAGRAADHSIARFFLELARTDLDDTTASATHAIAAAVVDDVVPRYLAAIGPARPRAVLPAAEVTVTLVRWPYT